MDILKKMFSTRNEKEKSSPSSNKDEFRKPQWFEEAETDDELFDDDRKFAFQVFTNPLEMQKHFELQMQRLLESFNDIDGARVDKNFGDDFMKPGFESNIFKEFEKHRQGSVDTDLDGEFVADKLNSLIQRLNPDECKKNDYNEKTSILPSNKKTERKFCPKLKLTDEETILGRIHGTITEDGRLAGTKSTRASHNITPEIIAPMTPIIPRSGVSTPFAGVFEGYQGPKMFSQSVMTSTVRKPDGTYETTKITKDSSGNQVTTVTRTINGKQETVTTYDGPSAAQKAAIASGNNVEKPCYTDRNLYVTKEGYAMQRNLW